MENNKVVFKKKESCKKGHEPFYYVSNQKCVKCVADYSKERYSRNKQMALLASIGF